MYGSKIKNYKFNLIWILFVALFCITSCSKGMATKPVLNKQTDEPTTILSSNTVYQTPTPTLEQTNENKRIKVPILMYHSVTDKLWGYKNLHVSPKELENQVKYLSENGYTSLHFSELNNVSQYKKPILLTFDDGYENNYTEAYPILKKYNIKATIFVCTNFINKKNDLTIDEIEKMKGLIDIQSHTVNHLDLSTLDDNKLDNELKLSKEKLEELTGKEITTLAYPAGKFNNKVIEFTKKYYKYGVMDRPTGFYTGEDHYKVKRLYISRETHLTNFIRLISS